MAPGLLDRLVDWLWSYVETSVSLDVIRVNSSIPPGSGVYFAVLRMGMIRDVIYVESRLMLKCLTGEAWSAMAEMAKRCLKTFTITPDRGLKYRRAGKEELAPQCRAFIADLERAARSLDLQLKLLDMLTPTLKKTLQLAIKGAMKLHEKHQLWETNVKYAVSLKTPENLTVKLKPATLIHPDGKTEILGIKTPRITAIIKRVTSRRPH